MLKNNKKTGVIENSKIGKNDNYDIGDNKNNKSKNIDKNSLKNVKINSDNIDYNPNYVYVELIKDIAKLERNITKRVFEFKKCPDCLQKITKAYEKSVNEKNKILKEYDMEKQFMSGNFIIRDPRNIINKLDNDISDIVNVKKNISCDKHSSDWLEINLDRIELDSLKESLKQFKK